VRHSKGERVKGEGRERKKERMKERKIRSGREGGAEAPTDMKSSSDMKASMNMKSFTEHEVVHWQSAHVHSM
jgi:hypothetical protein